MPFKTVQMTVEPQNEIQLINSIDIDSLHSTVTQHSNEIIPTLFPESNPLTDELFAHSRRVSRYAKVIGQLIYLPEKEIISLKTASFFHDIGKLCLPETIFSKNSHLECDEIETMQTHCITGYQLLDNTNLIHLKDAAVTAMQHHEHWDGSGYPNNLKENDIHLYARITTIADVFDALYSKRSYKPAWGLDKILAYFLQEKGHCFDPYLTAVFLDNLDVVIEEANLLQAV